MQKVTLYVRATTGKRTPSESHHETTSPVARSTFCAIAGAGTPSLATRRRKPESVRYRGRLNYSRAKLNGQSLVPRRKMIGRWTCSSTNIWMRQQFSRTGASAHCEHTSKRCRCSLSHAGTNGWQLLTPLVSPPICAGTTKTATWRSEGSAVYY